jgi:hypothetical protein
LERIYPDEPFHKERRVKVHTRVGR